MTSATGRESDKFMLRFPEGMRDRLKEEAARNKRSLNAEIISRLETTFEMDDYQPDENVTPEDFAAANAAYANLDVMIERILRKVREDERAAGIPPLPREKD